MIRVELYDHCLDIFDERHKHITTLRTKDFLIRLIEALEDFEETKQIQEFYI